MKNYLLKKLLSISFYPLCFIAVIWAVFAIEYFNNFNFVSYGVLPRTFSGLKGIIFSVFIHGGIDHIASNSLPILILGMMIFFFYKPIAKPAIIWIWLISGVWLWIGGRNNQYYPNYHIGASTLIYGFATFSFFSGLFRKHLRLMVVSALVVFMYGSIMWGIFPVKEEISWEGHLFGAIAGLLVAFSYRKEGPQYRKFDWEDEDDEDFPTGENERPDNEITINYIYKKDE